MARYTPRPPKAGRNRFDKPKGTRTVANDDKIASSTPNYVLIDDVDDVGKDPVKWVWYSQLYGPWNGSAKTAPATDQIERAYADARRHVERYLHKASAHTTGWGDVVGNERARTALLEAIEAPHAHKDLHAHYGIKAPKGALLWGPPGCGKTMFAKAAASALARLHGADTELLIINGAEIQSMWVGETEKTIRQVFAFARAYAAHRKHPLVIFVDEADAILPDRNAGYRFEASNVATFLTEMDGMAATGAFVILATNRPEAIDEAVLRDGRIDRRIKVERPTYDNAVLIAGHAMVLAPLAGGNPEQLVDYLFDPRHLLRPLTNNQTGAVHHFLLSHTVSGAMIVGLVERAKAIAMRRDLAAGTITGINTTDLRQAVDDAFAEAKGLEHDGALREFVETVAIPFEQARQRQSLN